MTRSSRRWVAGFLLAAVWSLPSRTEAGPYVNVMQPCDCPPTHYSALHVLTPSFYRWAAWCQGPCRYIFAQKIHPDISPTDYFVPYHCPAINPLQFSVANYPGLGGRLPSSIYQPPPAPEKKKTTETAPQPLPPPRLESEKKKTAPERLPPPREEPEKK